MAVEAGSTFEYKTIVPEGGTKTSPWVMESLESFSSTDDPVRATRLVGSKPNLYISDAGMTPNPGPSRPDVLLSELRLVATERKCVAVKTASYFLDKALVNVLRPGDVFHMALTACLGFGASAIRHGKLIFAIGDISAVPLGSGIQVRTPSDLVDEAERVFRRRDPKFEFPTLPIEVRSGDQSTILYNGIVEMAGYHVRVERGFRPGCPGSPTCVSISLDEACDWVAASASAQLVKMD